MNMAAQSAFLGGIPDIRAQSALDECIGRFLSIQAVRSTSLRATPRSSDPQRTELDNQIQLHVQMLTHRFILQGMQPCDAAAAARRQFGNTMLLRERHYEQRTLSIFVSPWRDLRFGLRQLQRNRILTFVAITSLGLGISANTAIFTALGTVSHEQSHP